MNHKFAKTAALWISLFIGSVSAFAQAPATRPAAPAVSPEQKAIIDAYHNTDTTTAALKIDVTPTEKDGSPNPHFGKPNEGFIKQHESFLARGKKGPIGVLFLGDSITAGWGSAAKIWNEHFGKYQPANFGISGDTTQNVLWRIDNGELDGISPKVVVLMIGTNNIPKPAADILRGDTKIVEEIHQKLPDTKLLLLGIFPRGADPTNKGVAAMREKIKTVNEGLAKLDDGNKTRYLDIGDKFLSPDGTLTKEIMPDALHPNAKGYAIWADAIQPLLDDMMK